MCLPHVKYLDLVLCNCTNIASLCLKTGFSSLHSSQVQLRRREILDIVSAHYPGSERLYHLVLIYQKAATNLTAALPIFRVPT